jgi:rhodanese-related sulfurtransferase
MNYINYKDISNEYILIDVRSNEEYSNSHFNNFINIPLPNILNGIKPFNRNSKIILYCDQGRRSQIAYRLLKSIGYNNVYILKK